jgi:hypothetical protein
MRDDAGARDLIGELVNELHAVLDRQAPRNPFPDILATILRQRDDGVPGFQLPAQPMQQQITMEHMAAAMQQAHKAAGAAAAERARKQLEDHEAHLRQCQTCRSEDERRKAQTEAFLRAEDDREAAEAWALASAHEAQAARAEIRLRAAEAKRKRPRVGGSPGSDSELVEQGKGNNDQLQAINDAESAVAAARTNRERHEAKLASTKLVMTLAITQVEGAFFFYLRRSGESLDAETRTLLTQAGAFLRHRWNRVCGYKPILRFEVGELKPEFTAPGAKGEDRGQALFERISSHLEKADPGQYSLFQQRWGELMEAVDEYDRAMEESERCERELKELQPDS